MSLHAFSPSLCKHIAVVWLINETSGETTPFAETARPRSSLNKGRAVASMPGIND